MALSLGLKAATIAGAVAVGLLLTDVGVNASAEMEKMGVADEMAGGGFQGTVLGCAGA